MILNRAKGGPGCWNLYFQLYFLLGFLIRIKQIHFTVRCVAGLHPEIANGTKEYKKWDYTTIAIGAH